MEEFQIKPLEDEYVYDAEQLQPSGAEYENVQDITSNLNHWELEMKTSLTTSSNLNLGMKTSLITPSNLNLGMKTSPKSPGNLSIMMSSSYLRRQPLPRRNIHTHASSGTIQSRSSFLQAQDSHTQNFGSQMMIATAASRRRYPVSKHCHFSSSTKNIPSYCILRMA